MNRIKVALKRSYSLACISGMSYFSQTYQTIKIFIMLISYQFGLNFVWHLRLKHPKAGYHTWRIENRMDISALEDTYLSSEYNTNLNDPKIIVDLGANIGDTSVLFANQYPNAKVWAIEPHPDTFRKLLHNTKNVNNITCLQLAVGNETGELQLGVGESHLGASVIKRKNQTNSITVQSLTLKDLLEKIGENKISLLKYDVEGAESLIFSDSSFEQHVQNAIGEVHLDLITENREEFLNYFSSYTNEVLELSTKRFILSSHNK